MFHKQQKGGLFGLFISTSFFITSTAAPRIPLYPRMVGLNPGMLSLWRRKSDALTARVDLTHSPQTIDFLQSIITYACTKFL